MISFSNINKQYGKQLLFVDASFQLNPGEKVGLVGPNGSGKTTLFRMVVGEETPDEGAVSVPKKMTIGYFRQDVEEMQGRSVPDEAIAGSGRVGDLHHELEALQREMSDPDKADDMDRILDRFGHVQEEYEHLGGYALEPQAREVLHGLGFKDDQIDGDVGALSGGWKMRVALARVLLGMPDVLLMDEPTNHLDIESIIWLEQFLKSFPGALLMTSHDREFMNRLVSKIAEIDSGEIITYSGDYDFYERERAVRESNQQAAFARQQSMLAKEQRFIDRFRTHAAKAAQVQSRIKALDKIEKVELPKKRQVVKFDFRVPPRSGGGAGESAQELRPACDLRRIQSHHPPRRTLGRHGEKRRGQDHAAQDDCRSQCSRCRKRAARRQPVYGLLRATIPGRAHPRSHRHRTVATRFSPRRSRGAAQPGGSIPVLRRRRR
jgi:ATPase subunit of ABC transporter with duplicated ATPase domains